MTPVVIRDVWPGQLDRPADRRLTEIPDRRRSRGGRSGFAAAGLDVAPEARGVALGLLILGRGEARLTDARFEEVGPELPVTGGGGAKLPDGPRKLDFGEG